MALKTDNINTESSIKNPFSKIKRKFNILIGLLITIILLLSILIIIFTTTNILGTSINDQMSNNSNVNKMQKINITNETDSEEDTTQIIQNSQLNIIYRTRWGGTPPLYERPQKVPVKYIIISHTASQNCFSLTDCSKLVQIIQKLHIDQGSPDIGYNFLIGGDANIYFGRGWDNHNFHMNRDTIGISYIGNYLYNVLSPEMIKATLHLLKEGVQLGKLTGDYIIVAHNQTWNTQSPGDNVYKQIKFWPHFSPDLLEDVEKH